MHTMKVKKIQTGEQKKNYFRQIVRVRQVQKFGNAD